MMKMIRRQKTPSSQPLLYLSLPFNKKQLASSTKTPEDYLAELPPARDLDPSRLSSLIRAELLRVSEGRPMPPLDASRYRLDPPPPDRRGDAGAWRACLDNARAQLEHQGNRVVNLELALRFGARAAEANAAHSAAAAALLKSEAREALSRVEGINRRRKLEQERAAEEVREHEERWVRGVRKCAEIEAACARLEEEVAALAAEAGEGAKTARAKAGKDGATAAAANGNGKRGRDESENFGLPPLPGGEAAAEEGGEEGEEAAGATG